MRNINKMGFTPYELKDVEAYLDGCLAILEFDGEEYSVETESDTYYYSKKEDLLDDIRVALNEWLILDAEAADPSPSRVYSVSVGMTIHTTIKVVAQNREEAYEKASDLVDFDGSYDIGNHWEHGSTKYEIIEEA